MGTLRLCGDVTRRRGCGLCADTRGSSDSRPCTRSSLYLHLSDTARVPRPSPPSSSPPPSSPCSFILPAPLPASLRQRTTL
eukprot:748297-Rhodomonas_salina.3